MSVPTNHHFSIKSFPKCLCPFKFAHYLLILKILIVRFSSIGDIVLTTPVIRCLKLQKPEAEIYYLTKDSYKSLLAPNPYLSGIIGLKEDLNKTVQELQAMNFDVVVDLHHNLRSLRIKRKLGIPSHSFNKLNVQKWLMVNFKINRLPEVHIVDRYLETVSALGVYNDGAGLDFFFSKADFEIPDLPEKYLAFAIGGQHNTKKLPVQKIAAIADKLKLPLVLLGGKEDMENAKEIAEQSSNPDVIDKCGLLSIEESARIIENGVGLLTHDTGMMHIAAALDKPIISIWGNTIPEFGMYPFFPEASLSKKNSVIFEVKPLSCRPCSKIGYKKCPQKHFKCMWDQDTDAIAAHANSLD